MRDFEITDNRVSYYTLHAYWNHSKKQYCRHYKGSHMCGKLWAKKLRARMWMWFGVAV